ncbi:alpha/beta-hydrolase [Polyplosphaeria fusca]|uniref:Alpha/beta-hydrolase n=1 Tax=Polyplosphaeria fusca TaxID=682080 RepID=A0A9P4V321_9PLEO|nr:alpha/beta-hydrolase [Polyplosphaeria fusca]
MASIRSTPATRFESFNLYKTPYKKVGDHDIDAHVAVPKGIKPGTHPLIVNFHGGGLTSGDAIYPEYKAAFWVPFTHRNSAILVLPNHRLAPESSGADMLSDLADFWTWLHTAFPTYLSSQDPSLKPDLSRILVAGESAGGYMAIQSALTLPPNSLRAVLAQYPMTRRLDFTPEDTPMGMPLTDRSPMDAHLAAMKPGDMASSATPPDRQFLVLLSAYGLFDKYFGTGKDLWPITRVEDVDVGALPPMWIVHGEQDSAVPLWTSQVFVDKMRELGKGDEKVTLITAEGDHGFDLEIEEEDVEWLKLALGEIEGVWVK